MMDHRLGIGQSHGGRRAGRLRIVAGRLPDGEAAMSVAHQVTESGAGRRQGKGRVTG